MEQLQDIDQLLTVETDNGVLFKICLGVALFFKGDQQQEKRQAVLEILADYRDLVGDQLTWTTNPSTGKWKKLEGFDSYITPFDWLPTYGAGQWQFVYHGGQRRSDADNHSFVVLGTGHNDNISYLYCQFPIDFFIEREQKLPALVQQWCEKLKPEHGYAGFWLGQSYGYEDTDEAIILEHKFGQRFPGIQINGFSTHSLNLHRGPKGVDWLTILSDQWLERLGGLDHVKTEMGELPVLEYNGGAILRAGPMPQFGDSEDPEVNAALADYRRVAAIIEPIRIKDHQGIHSTLSPSYRHEKRFDAQEYQAWLARFSPQGGER
ncbi:type VI immunity family protein [Billgrantia sp. Q4P2]|uniref:type VI immunity family protein n=1 Tax=Billgrantia sp. Q4P2 TaxID=3463857 RepID=UPI0040577164